MLYQGPKWHSELNSMKKKIKGLSSQQKKKMVDPNPLKRFKLKTHEGIDLGAHETKGRKEEA